MTQTHQTQLHDFVVAVSRSPGIRMFEKRTFATSMRAQSTSNWRIAHRERRSSRGWGDSDERGPFPLASCVFVVTIFPPCQDLFPLIKNEGMPSRGARRDFWGNFREDIFSQGWAPSLRVGFRSSSGGIGCSIRGSRGRSAGIKENTWSRPEHVVVVVVVVVSS